MKDYFLNIKKGKLFKKYSLRCQYCGHIQYKTLWILKLKLIFTNKIYYNCPKCHKTNCFLNIFHLRHESTDSKEKENNRNKLWDSRLR